MTDSESETKSETESETSAPDEVDVIPLDLSPHWSLDPSITFLNHGSFGACPRRIQHLQTELRTQMELEPVRFFTHALPGLLDRARAEAADFVGASAEQFAFVTNTTEAVNAVLRSLELETDDEILITDHGYGACINAANFVADRAGARVVTAKLPFPVEDPDQIVDAIIAGVTDRTRIAVIDHITAFSAMVLPINDIVVALKERGVDTIVDGAHAPGIIDLDLDDLDAAYYAGNFHKWVCAPRGAAFLRVRDDLVDSVRPVSISHGATRKFDGASRFHLEFDWTGTRDFTPWLCVPETIDFLRSLLPGGWEGIRRRNRRIAIDARDLLCKTLGTEPICPESMVGFTAGVDLPVPAGPLPKTPFETDPLQSELFADHGIEVPILIILSPPRRILRISAHLYNQPKDFQVLASALDGRITDH